MIARSIRTTCITLILIFAAALGCGGNEESGHEDIGRGPFLCSHYWVRKKRDGTMHTYNKGIKIYVDGKEYKPDDYPTFNEDLAGCESSPNQDVTALKVLGVNYDRGGTYLLRKVNDKVDLAHLLPYDTHEQGEWSNDGRWLIFRNFLINVETGEKRPIHQLPEPPNSFTYLGVSPDLKTVVMTGTRERDKDTITLKLIDAESGTLKEPTFKFSAYPWLVDDGHTIPGTGANYLWVSNQFKWTKDAQGKDQLSYPIAEVEVKAPRVESKKQ